MQADNPIVDYSCQRKPVKHIIDLVEDRVRFLRVFAESASTFVEKSKSCVNLPVLVIASKQVYFFWKFDFERHKKANCL